MASPTRGASASRGAAASWGAPERDRDDLDDRPSSQGGGGGGGSSVSACPELSGSSGDVSSDDPGDAVAGLLLACLHCRFQELGALLPGACGGALSRCFPAFRRVGASLDGEQQRPPVDRPELDCHCCSSCQDAGGLVELAMEISQVCYR